MDIESLRYVVTLADELHFGHAAQRHHISAGHFGRQVLRLEHELGQRLFRRTSRRVELTPTGTRVVAYAAAVLKALDELRASADRLPPGAVGALHVGILGFGMAERWSRLRDTLNSAIPDVQLVHHELDMRSQYDAVRRGEVDFAVVHDSGNIDGLVFQRVFATPRVAVVPAWSPLADAEQLSRTDVADAHWIGVPMIAEWDGVRTTQIVANPAAIPTAVATTGLLGVHGAVAARYFARPDVRFVPLEGDPIEVAIVTREDDTRPMIETVRLAAAAFDHDRSGT